MEDFLNQMQQAQPVEVKTSIPAIGRKKRPSHTVQLPEEIYQWARLVAFQRNIKIIDVLRDICYEGIQESSTYSEYKDLFKTDL